MEMIYQLTGYHTVNLIIPYYDTYYLLPCIASIAVSPFYRPIYLFRGTLQWYNTIDIQLIVMLFSEVMDCCKTNNP